MLTTRLPRRTRRRRKPFLRFYALRTSPSASLADACVITRYGAAA